MARLRERPTCRNCGEGLVDLVDLGARVGFRCPACHDWGYAAPSLVSEPL